MQSKQLGVRGRVTSCHSSIANPGKKARTSCPWHGQGRPDDIAQKSFGFEQNHGLFAKLPRRGRFAGTQVILQHFNRIGSGPAIEGSAPELYAAAPVCLGVGGIPAEFRQTEVRLRELPGRKWRFLLRVKTPDVEDIDTARAVDVMQRCVL